MIIYYLIHNPIRLVLLYLNQSAHIIDQICESDVKCRPNYPDSSEKQSLHALFHETIDMGIVLAIFYKNEGPQRDSDDNSNSNSDSDDDTASDDIDPETQKPYWDVPEPDKDELTVRYRFRR